MAWVKSEEDLGQHPKTIGLMAALDADLPTTVGILHLLWHFTLKFAWRNGDLSKFTDAAIAHAVGWKGKPDALIRALEENQWLERKRVHDWLDHAGKIINDRRYAESRRKSAKIAEKSTKRRGEDVEEKGGEKKREHKGGAFEKPSAEEVTAYGAQLGYKINGREFVDHYEARGWRLKGNMTMKDWRATVRTWINRWPDFNNGNPVPRIPPPPKPREPEPELSDADRAEAGKVFGNIKALLKPKEVPHG